MAGAAQVGTPTVDSGDKNSFTLTAPTGLASGDHQLIVGTVGTGSETWGTTPTGFTLAWDSGSIGGADTFRVVIYVWNGATNTGSVVCTKSGTRHGHFVRAAWRGGTGFDLATDANAVTASGTSHAFPSQTTSGADNTTIGVSVIDTGPPGGTNAWTKPGTWDTEVYDASTHGAQPEDISIGIFAELTAATATAVTGSATSTLTDVAAVWSARLAGVAGGVTAPTVAGGVDATINLGATFSRTATENANGGTITARTWKIISGPSNIGDTIGTAAALSWVPGDDGVWVIRYSATNSAGTGTDDVQVTVNPVAPVVGAGADATGVPTYQVFSRTATEDNKGNAVSARQWKVISGPDQVSEVIGTQLLLEWRPMKPGVYVLRYTATNIGGNGTDDVSVTVVLAPPVVQAGTDVSFVLGSVFNRNGSFIGQPDEVVGWTVVSGPSNVGNNLSPGNIGISWVPPFLGTYVLRFSGSNGAGTATDDVSIAVTPPPAPEEPPEDEWSYLNVPWGVEIFTLRDQLPGQQYEFDIRAVDIYNNTSAWSAASYAQSEPDELPPSVPAAGTVAASRMAMQVTHLLGKASGGTFNLEPDLNYLKVHILANPGDTHNDTTVENGGTFAGVMKAGPAELIGQIPVVGTFPIPQTQEVWVGIVAVDNYGNESTLSQCVQATAELIDDAYISNLTVSKVTAGTITSDWIQAAEMKTGTTGSRVRIGYFGIELYDDDNNLTLDANTSDGSLFLVGTIATAQSGRRVIIDGQSNMIKFTPQGTDARFAKIWSYIPTNYPDDIAIEMRATDSDETSFFSRFYLLPDQAAMTISPLGAGGDFVSVTRVYANEQFSQVTARVITGTIPYTDGEDQLVAEVTAHTDGRAFMSAYESDGTQRALVQADDGGSGIMKAFTSGGQLRGQIWAGVDFAAVEYYEGSLQGGMLVDTDNIRAYYGGNIKWRSVSDGLEVFSTVYTHRVGGLSNGRVIYKTDISGTDIFWYDNGGTVAMARTSDGGASGSFVKNFVIPHPTAEDKWLVHGCTESPHAGVEYWGEATVEDGEVTVPLPQYFEDLTRRAGRAVFVTVLAEDNAEERKTLKRMKKRRKASPIPEDDNGKKLMPPAVPPGRPSVVQATYPKDGEFTIYSEGPVDTFRVYWMVKAIRADVPELNVEPLRSEVTVRGEAPYTYLG
jgi:hypothetical protein